MQTKPPLSAQVNQMTPRGFFVTGTDTGVGKTWVSLALMRRLQMAGIDAVGMKPVASGCELEAGQWVNADASLLRSQASVLLPYQDINPYAFEPAIAPHLAAAEAGLHIDLERVVSAHRRLRRQGLVTVIEGVGGWQVPLNAEHTVADLALRLGQPVVLVVAVRLGCLNHALLSAHSIVAKGVELAGWVAIPWPETERTEANLHALRERIVAPCLGVLPWLPDLDVDRLAEALPYGEELAFGGAWSSGP